jgi:low temperature requirement protein LtrA
MRKPGQPWRRPMTARDPHELHRQASFLELFFDLCFVVAIAQAAAQLHHALADNHAGAGLLGYLAVFFAIWWAWMNFTWFASAYDNDDVPYRVAALAQIVGALILAAGVPRAFESHDFAVIFLGYAVMRAGLVALWLRAAWTDRVRRRTALRFAIGLAAVMLGWSVMLVAGRWPLWGWWLMAAAELAVPIWAERAGKTAWHPHHIAEARQRRRNRSAGRDSHARSRRRVLGAYRLYHRRAGPHLGAPLSRRQGSRAPGHAQQSVDHSHRRRLRARLVFLRASCPRQ